MSTCLFVDPHHIPELTYYIMNFDATFRGGLKRLINVELSDLPRIQAGLSLRDGGLAIYSYIECVCPRFCLLSA